MQDVFISYSHADKHDFVRPLVQSLQSHSISVWFDEFSVYSGELIQSEIMNGISNSLLTIAIISEKYLSSCWTMLELGMKLISSEDKNLIPILHNIDSEVVAKKCPFLLDHKYLNSNNASENIVTEIIQAVNHAKNRTGFFYTKKTQLHELVKRLHVYNNIKLDKLAIKINNFVKFRDENFLSAVHIAATTANEILYDIAESEHIFFERNDEIVKTIRRSGILNENLLSHFELIYHMQKHINPLSTVDNMAEDRYLLQVSLYSIADYYSLTYFRLPIIKEVNICAVIPSQISKEDIEESHNIETLVLPPELIADINTTTAWYEHNPLTLLGARDVSTGKLVGFINTLPVSDKLFENIREGYFDDTSFSTDDIMQYNVPGIYRLYISSFCIHPKYNGNINVFRFIYNAFIDMLITLATEHEIFISEIVADGATEKGKSLCESLGMIKQSRSQHDTDVYHVSLIPPSVSTIKLNSRQGRRLIELYNEYRDHY